MIVGTFLKYFKTYQGINYIPITDEDKFCGLVGNNGIGKSSVLEALDCFFNSKQWNYNTVTKKSGLQHTQPLIVPVFIFNKNLFDGKLQKKAEALHSAVMSITEGDVAPAHKPHIKNFIDHRNEITKKIEDSFILPIGVDYDGNLSISIFNNRVIVEALHGTNCDASQTKLDESELNEFRPLLDKIKKSIDYIYIPREIEPELFTKLEANEIQTLMGETLNEILSSRVPQAKINDINKSLNEFIDSLSNELEEYSYRTPTDRQQNLRKNDVYNLIIQSFFSARKLHKKHTGGNWLEISSLSSGEKQKAIIDVAHSLLSKHRANGSNLIVGIDEPEASLHMSACFDQFDSLYDISRDCMQVIFSSHWYGFLPIVESGSATIISKEDGSHVFDQINLRNFREQIKQASTSSKGKLPYDIRLKSVNDLVQSVITSSMGENPFNWIICEGSSERIYLSSYLSDLITSKRLRIVPVGGAKEIKRLYNHLSTSYEDFKDEITGKIILLSDTDSEMVSYEVKTYTNLICKRIVNDSKSKATKLVNINSNPVSPETVIEDALNGRLFVATLKKFSKKYPKLLHFIDEISEKTPELASQYALDLKSSQWDLIDEFFSIDNNKFNFAQEYSSLNNSEYKTPSWIKEIREWLK
jgi:predicted ATP-dependent endonuclease of OLD family